MKILSTISEIKDFANEMKRQGKTIGLVPTMGALHEGHLSLIKKSKELCDVTIVSVFVNPTQFGPNEDFDAYPRIFDQDCEKLRAAEVDAVFHPTPEEMYPENFCTYVNVEGDFTKKLCGASRPIHFRGVATVVTKLFNLSRADKAFFGQKDAQQVVVVKRFTADLNLPVEIVMCPIVREENGLARSSRNRYLSKEEKQAALVLSKSLKLAQEKFLQGERNVAALEKFVTEIISQEKMAVIDYVKIYEFPTLNTIETIGNQALLALAVKFGTTRLIDNVILK